MRPTILYFVISIFFITFSCEGPEGDQGPIGQQGLPGPQGQPGTVGQPVKSYTVTATKASWQSSNPDTKTRYSITIQEPSLTAKSIDEDIILGFYRVVSDQQQAISKWYNLPLTIMHNDANTMDYGFVESVTLNYYPGIFTIEYSLYNRFKDPSSIPFSPMINNNDYQFRIVVIPAIPNGRRATIDYKNYEEVQKAFNISD